MSNINCPHEKSGKNHVYMVYSLIFHHNYMRLYTFLLIQLQGYRLNVLDVWYS